MISKDIKKWWKKYSNQQIAGAAIIVLVIIAFVSYGTQVPSTTFRGSAIQDNITITAKTEGRTIDLTWNEIQNASLYEIYFSENNPDLDLKTGTLIESIPSFAWSFTPYSPGYYRVYTETTQGTIGSNIVKVSK